MATWLITGGSGFLGINLIRFLLQRGEKVISLDLLPFDYADCENRIEHIEGDIRDENTLNACMRNVDIVVHGAAALPLYSKDDIFSTNIAGTESVLRSACKNGVSRAIYISSTAVYGIPDHHPLHEDDLLVGVGAYGESKIEAEKIVREYRSTGLTVSTLRPKSFIGPERLGVFGIFYQWASEGRSFPMIGRGENFYQLLDVEDLCTAIWQVAQFPSASSIDTEFNIGAKDFSTMKEDYQVVLDAAGHGRQIKNSPAGLVVFILELLDSLNLSPLYPWVYKTATKDSFVSIDKAERVFGFSPRYSNQQALLRNYEWFLENIDKFQGGKTQDGVTHRVPWKQGVLSLIKRFF